MTGYHKHTEQPVNLARPAPRQTAGTKPGAANLAMRELRTRRGDHAVAVEVSAPPELDTVPKDRQGWIKTIEFLPDGGPNEHAAGGDAEPLLRLVALPLIDLVHIEVEFPAPGVGNADPDLADRLAAVPTSRQQQLWACQVDALVCGYVSQ
jgi:hypothetical protein